MWITISDIFRLINFSFLLWNYVIEAKEKDCTADILASSLVVALRLPPPFAKTKKYSNTIKCKQNYEILFCILTKRKQRDLKMCP
jgi:hypothetical protein